MTGTDRSQHDVQQWLRRCRDLAVGDLDGIEEASQHLAACAQGDRALMERARRVLRTELAQRPGDAVVIQMLALWRRAFEKGDWSWDDESVQSPLLS